MKESAYLFSYEGTTFWFLKVGSRINLEFYGKVEYRKDLEPTLKIGAQILGFWVPHNDGVFVVRMDDGRVVHLEPFAERVDVEEIVGWDEGFYGKHVDKAAWSFMGNPSEEVESEDDGMLPTGPDIPELHGVVVAVANRADLVRE